MKVLVPYSDELVQLLQDLFGDKAEVVRSEGSIESMLENGRDATIIISGRVSREYIHKAINLKMIQTFGAGTDKVDFDAVRERGDIIVCNSHTNSAEVAEFAISLLFAVVKNIIPSDRELRKGDWSHSWGGPVPNVEIRGKRVLIVGLGHIGADVARRLRSFSVTINAATLSGSSRNADLVDKMVRINDIQSQVEEADFIILSLPLTNQSKGLVDREFLSWMKPSSILVNISRGPIVDELALYEALKAKNIRGAGLDVWWRYPKKWRGMTAPPTDIPFHELDNVVMSPHRAAFAENSPREQREFVVENILRFIRGEPPHNIIDPERGY